MRTANTILELIGKRGEKGLPLERVYKLFFTFEIWAVFCAWSDDRAGHFEVTSSVVRPGVESAHHNVPG